MISIISYSKQKNGSSKRSNGSSSTIYVGGNASSSVNVNVDLSNYYTKSEIEVLRLWFEGENTNHALYIDGSNNNVMNDYEVAIGQYNQTFSGAVFTIGNGTSDSGRSNVFWATNDEVYAPKLSGNTISFITLTGHQIKADTGNFTSLTASTATTDVFNATNANITAETANTISTNGLTAFTENVNMLTANYADANTIHFKTGQGTDLTVDNLEVTKAAHLFSLIIDEVKSVGGRIILTSANANIDYVEEKDKYFRCYFAATDGDKEIKQQFVKDDQVICQTFNAATGTSYNVSNQYYWRLCTSASTTTVVINGKDHWYIDLSKTDKDSYSNSIPKAGDKVVLLGNRTNSDRQDAIILSAYRDTYLDPTIKAPSFVQYSGITDYNLASHRLNYISASGNRFVGDFESTSDVNALSEILDAAKNYADGKYSEATNYSDTKYKNATNYADKQYSAATGYTASQIKQTKDSINITVASLSDDVSTNTANISQLKVSTEGLSSTVSDFNKVYETKSDATDKYNSATGYTASQIKQTKDSLTSTITELETKLDTSNLIKFDVNNWASDGNAGQSISYDSSTDTVTMKYTIANVAVKDSSGNITGYNLQDIDYVPNYTTQTTKVYNIPNGKYLLEFTPILSADDVRLHVSYWTHSFSNSVSLISYTTDATDYNGVKQSFLVNFDGDATETSIGNRIYFESAYNANNQGQAQADWSVKLMGLSLRKIIDDTVYSKFEQTANSFSFDIKNKLGEAGVFIGSKDSSTTPHIELNGNTKIKGDLKVEAQNNADAITLINSSGQPVIELMNKSIDDTITNVKSGKFGGTSQILFGWGTETHTQFYDTTVVTDVCYIQAGKKYVISGMNFTKNTDGAGSISPVTITLKEGGTVLKSYTDEFISNFNGTYTATHTGWVTLTASFSAQFTVMARHPSFVIKGIVTRDSDSIIAFGDGGFAFGVDTNKNMYMNKNGMVIRWDNEGVKFDDYGMTRLCADGSNELWMGEKHKIVVANSSGYWWQGEKSMSYDTILAIYDGSCTITLAPYSYIDGMTVNIIDKCSHNCYVNFYNKSFIRANRLGKETSSSYELDGNRTWKFMYSSALDAWLEIAFNS